LQLPDNIKKSVVFLAMKNPVGGYVLGGTAFIISYPSKIDGLAFQFLVTARHNIEKFLENGLKEFSLRVNCTDGTAKWVDMPLDGWIVNEAKACDLALKSFSLGDNLDWDHYHIPYDAFVDSTFIERWHVQEGDEVFSVGLYKRHEGTEKNIPIVRVGNIASMEQPDIPTKFGATRAYLIESRSIAGLSGSPVFVNLGAFRAQRTDVDKPAITLNLPMGGNSIIFGLLGIMHGHFDIKDEDSNKSVNEGIGVVIPAMRILEVLAAPFFQDQMRKRENEMLKRKEVTMDTPFP